MMKHRVLLFVILTIFGLNLKAQKAKLVYTTPTERWVEVRKSLKASDSKADITISDEKLHVIDGFGGSFNELGYTALDVLGKKEQSEVMEALFGEDGCRFTMCRLPLGASDYALSYYSSCDVAEDFEMRDFNIDRDRFILIPYIKEALKINPDIKLWASPWSPPAWMKVNEHYAMRSGEFGNATDGNKMVPDAEILNNATGFKMQERYLKAYALYFAKFVQEYEKAGVKLWGLMPQNEVAYQPNWPSCTWRPEDMAYFIGKYMGPKLEELELSTEIWLGTINSGDPNYVRTILDNKDAAKYIKGVGFQWGGSKSLPSISKEYTDLKFMQTENKCGEHENDWTSLNRSWNTLTHYTTNGCGSYMYWNMVLDETGSSAWGWPQNSMVVINSKTKEVTYTDEFYLFKHLSYFVKPGAHFLKSEGKNQLAFMLEDGTKVVLVYNPEEKEKELTIAFGEKKVKAALKATSINTIVLN